MLAQYSARQRGIRPAIPQGRLLRNESEGESASQVAEEIERNNLSVVPLTKVKV
jgi:hypothetical protein